MSHNPAPDRSIAFIGGGNMAFALASGILRAGPGRSVVVSDPVPEQLARFADAPVRTTLDNLDAVAGASVVVLAVKPQVMEGVARELAEAIDPQQLVVSIAAGVTVSALRAWLGSSAIVRCMPNTPALVGKGVTGLYADSGVSAAQRDEAEELLRAVGDAVWFEEEGELDAVTALSGSGPAYFFAVIEALIEGGVELGLSREVAHRLVTGTAVGAAAMIGPHDDPGELRVRVTSPGGTTERALSVLASGGVPHTLRQAVHGAWQRSRELSGVEADGHDGAAPTGGAPAGAR